MTLDPLVIGLTLALGTLIAAWLEIRWLRGECAFWESAAERAVAVAQELLDKWDAARRRA